MITATEIAERAVSELRRAAHENDATLGERVRAAERCCIELDRQVSAGDVVLTRLSRVVVAARSLNNVPVGGHHAGCELGRSRSAVIRRSHARTHEPGGGMTRLLRDVRVIPIVLIAISALFILKATGLILNGSYTLSADDDVTGTVTQRPGGGTAAPIPDVAASAAPRSRSWAQEMFNFPDITGAVKEASPKAESEPKDKAKAKGKAQNPPPTPDGTQIPVDGRPLSPAERAVLERLGERRAELDARAKELEMRESLILAAEKRLESRVAQLKQLEAQINEGARVKDEEEATRLKNIITMYENMKPKDAARVFDRLELRILFEVASQINPRRMSDIMAQMAPEAAERLTVELASRAKDKPPAELPKIVGTPATN